METIGRVLGLEQADDWVAKIGALRLGSGGKCKSLEEGVSGSHRGFWGFGVCRAEV